MSAQAKGCTKLGNLFAAVANHVATSQRWQGTWKLVHGCGKSCHHEVKVAGDLETCAQLWQIMSPRVKGGRGLGNLFTAVATHITPSQRWQGTRKLVHGCGNSYHPKPKVAGDSETCSWLWQLISPRAKGGRGLGNLFTAVATHITPSQRWQGTRKLVHSCGKSCRPEPKVAGD